MSTEHDDALKLWVVLSRAHDAVARLARADIARHGLTEGEFGVLELLFHKGPQLLGEVRRKTLVSSGGTTYLIDRLVGKGLVERRPCPEDRRAIYAALTDEGEALLRGIFPPHAEAIEEAVSGLAPEERRQATVLLRKLGRAAAEREGTAAPGD